MRNIKVHIYVAVATPAGQPGIQKQPLDTPFGYYAEDDMPVYKVLPQPYRWGVYEDTPPFDLGLYHIRGRVFLDESMSFRKQSVNSGDTLVATNFMDMEVIGAFAAEHSWPPAMDRELSLRSLGRIVIRNVKTGINTVSTLYLKFKRFASRRDFD